VNHSAKNIVPVILSGGSGSRLWPVSRTHYPKQFLALNAAETMLQQIALRVKDYTPPLVVCNSDHRFVVAEQFGEVGLAPRDIVLEPEGRSTAPAIAVAAIEALRHEPEAILLVLPSDLDMGDLEAFHSSVEIAATAADAGALVTFGVKPRGPATGFGYIVTGEPFSEIPGCVKAARFVEKPDETTAKSLIAGGGVYWNSGMFVLGAQTYLDELARFEPQVVQACLSSVSEGVRDLDFFRLDAEAFGTAPAISIDYAVMERTDRTAVVPLDLRWDDLGSWEALWRLGENDGAGNTIVGDAVYKDVSGSYLRSEGPLVTAIGVSDLVVVATEDAVLIAPRGESERVKELVELLDRADRSEHIEHQKTYRPWGSFQRIDFGEHFQVKRITVNPGSKLSLQRHRYRAEHWIVVEGKATVTRNDEVFELEVNQSTYIPAGTRHRLENRTSNPLLLIEVQSGSYLGEDDIERFDDDYGRDMGHENT